MPLTEAQIQSYRDRFRKLSNTARYEEAYALAKKLKSQHPEILLFHYYEAVMTAEDDFGPPPAEVMKRYKAAARKFRILLGRARGMSPQLRRSVRNEYYWFSRQPLKQYRLGLEEMRKGNNGYYPQGVGAAELAKKYALQGREALCLRWAKISEKAWLAYFKEVPNWYNSYLFYAAALGCQGKMKEMEKAFAKAARIAGKPKGWKAIRHYRAEVMRARSVLEKQKTAKI